MEHCTRLYSRGHAVAERLGHVAALSHGSLTNDQQHKDDNEDYKEGVAISYYQLHQADLKIFCHLLGEMKGMRRSSTAETSA